MIILAVDTAHAACSSCVYDADGDEVLAAINEPMRQGHAERLASMVQEVLASAGLGMDRIDRLAACNGPGTFTGVRIGLAFVRGLSLVLDVPAVGVSTFQSLAAQARHEGAKGDIWVVQDARRSEVYVQGFDAMGKPLSEAEVLGMEAAKEYLSAADGTVIGTGTALVDLPESLRRATPVAWPDIAGIARLAAGVEPDSAPPSPFYLRTPDAKVQAPLVRHEDIEVKIRQVGPDSAPILAALHAAAFEEAWDAASLRELVSSPGCICLVADCGKLSDAGPCGFVLARKAADEMEILTIAVLPSLRRRGVGKALLERLSRVGREANARSVFIEYAADNAAAEQLYARAGFQNTGVRRHYYRRAGGTRCDAVTARLDL